MICGALITAVSIILVTDPTLVHSQSLSYEPMTSVYGTAICATDEPNAVISIPDVVPSISYERLSGVTYCGMQCLAFSGCQRFNFWQSSSGSSTGSRKCELYTYVPVHCTTTNNLCQYFKVSLKFAAFVCCNVVVSFQ